MNNTHVIHKNQESKESLHPAISSKYEILIGYISTINVDDNNLTRSVYYDFKKQEVLVYHFYEEGFSRKK